MDEQADPGDDGPIERGPAGPRELAFVVRERALHDARRRSAVARCCATRVGGVVDPGADDHAAADDAAARGAGGWDVDVAHDATLRTVTPRSETVLLVVVAAACVLTAGSLVRALIGMVIIASAILLLVPGRSV